MTLPLYDQTMHDTARRNPRGHAGLWYDKFCNTWNQDGNAWRMTAGHDGHNPKLTWINTVTGQRVGEAQRLDEYASRMTQLVESRGGRWAALTTESRFITGLGRSHPVENGFAWHPTLGVPYLPGSSIKGMTRAWAVAEGEPCELVKLLFGEQDHGGGINFLDAVPIEPVQLEADVMTPHYAGWSEDDPPGDWRSPTPIPFLSAAAQCTFLFAILPGKDTDASHMNRAWCFIGDALAWAGAGAKTAVGYGRLVEAGGTAQMEQRRTRSAAIQAERERQIQAEVEREERLARLSPVQRQIHEALERRNNPDEPATTTIYQMIERDIWSGPERTEALHWLADRMRADGRWKETTNARRPERDRDHQRTLQIKAWMEED